MKVQTIGERSHDFTTALNQEAQKEQRLRETLEWLQKSSAIRHGHYRFGRGSKRRCGGVFVDPRLLFGTPHAGKTMAQGLMDAIPHQIRNQTQVVAGPPTCGIMVARDLADFLSSSRPLLRKGDDDTPIEDVTAVFFDRSSKGVYRLSPSSKAHVKGKRVLIADEVRYTGNTFGACITAIEKSGGQVIGTAELIDRGLPVKESVPNFYVGQLDPDPLYLPSECPWHLSANRKDRKYTKF